MKGKTFEERYSNETLSDNSQIEYCKKCKNCLFRDDGTVWSNHYTKSSCMIYQYPNYKPINVINNKGTCEYYREE